MRNIKLTIAYDGTGYAGWQRQLDQPTIQGVLEDKLAVMARGKITLHGAGRTDAGVHALGMVANFHTLSNIPLDGFFKGLNSLLPDDIRILGAEEMVPAFHARLAARGKRYEYYLTNLPVPLPQERLYSHNLTGEFDIAPIRQCLNMLVGKHDFSSFEAAGSRDPSIETGRGAVRTITSATLESNEYSPGHWYFAIAGDGFLRHMVRNIIGTLIEVGKGRRSVHEFREIMAARDRDAAGPTAPAKGLCLKEVYY